MKRPSIIFSRSICFLLILLAVSPCPDAVGEQLLFVLKSGSSLTVDAKPQSIEWTTVNDSGELQKRQVRLSEIKKLDLVAIPSSQQVAVIKRLLSELGNPDFKKRDQAEKSLMDEELAGPYLGLIKLQKNHPVFEVQYRVNRIISHLEDQTNEAAKPAEFDKLTLKTGAKLNGDAGDWTIKCNYRGAEIEFNRDQVRMIASTELQPDSPAPIASVPISSQTFQKPDGEFYLPGQTLIEFETDPEGYEIQVEQPVENLFLSKGIRFGAEGHGYFARPNLSFEDYKNEVPDLAARGKTICIYENIGQSSKTMFRGVANITFCVPGRPNIVAGVKAFGTYIGKIEHSRDFLLEAYNADGHLLATTEASDTGIVFMGVKSNELITRIRILSNPYLFRVSREVSDTFAIDHVCFSPPERVRNSAIIGDGNVVRLDNGDILQVDRAQFSDTKTLELTAAEFGKTLEIPVSDLAAVNFAKDIMIIDGEHDRSKPEYSPHRGPVHWLAMLQDRSLIKVTGGATFTSYLFEKLEFPRNDLVCLSSATIPLRYPPLSDFENADNVLVFPTCRIVSSNLKFDETGYQWSKSDKKILQDVNIKVIDPTDEEEGEAPEDPSPQHTSVKYGKTFDSDIPTAWFQKPLGRQPGTGLLRLKDNQQLVLNGAAGFRIKQITSNQITISNGDSVSQIPWSDVFSIEFPTR